MNPEQLQILQHSLGVDQYGHGQQYRNHFCAGGADEAICRELVAMGYMRRHPTMGWLPCFDYSVTEEGKPEASETDGWPEALPRVVESVRRFPRHDVWGLVKAQTDGGRGMSTTIEWTDATWNPVTGCTKMRATRRSKSIGLGFTSELRKAVPANSPWRF